MTSVVQPTENHPAQDPQLTSALALVALRQQYPALPWIDWRLTAEGHLSGTAHDRESFAAYVAVLGGVPAAPVFYQFKGQPRVTDQLFVTWQDVEFSLSGVYSMHPEAVAA